MKEVKTVKDALSVIDLFYKRLSDVKTFTLETGLVLSPESITQYFNTKDATINDLYDSVGIPADDLAEFYKIRQLYFSRFVDHEPIDFSPLVETLEEMKEFAESTKEGKSEVVDVKNINTPKFEEFINFLNNCLPKDAPEKVEEPCEETIESDSLDDIMELLKQIGNLDMKIESTDGKNYKVTIK